MPTDPELWHELTEFDQERSGISRAGRTARYLAGRRSGSGHRVCRKTAEQVARCRSCCPMVLVQGGLEGRRTTNLAAGPGRATKAQSSERVWSLELHDNFIGDAGVIAL